MNKHVIPRFTKFLVVYCVLVTQLNLSACQPTTTGTSIDTSTEQAELIVEGFIDAQNAGDVERALAFLVDDAVIQLIPPPIEGDDGIFTGKEEIRAWYENLATINGEGEISNLSVTGDQVTAILTYTDDSLKQIGVETIDNHWVVTVQDGKIHNYTATVTDESLEELMNAMTSSGEG